MSSETYFYVVMFLYLIGALINFQLAYDHNERNGIIVWFVALTWMFSTPFIMFLARYLDGDEDDDSKNSGV